MLPEIETLLVLQDRDQKLRRLQQDLRRMPQDAANARQRLAEHEAALQSAKQATADNELAMKKLELDIDTRKTTISRLRTQQFETRKNEEYRALDHEIERYGQEIVKLEDSELVLMEKAEELKKRVAAASAALVSTRALVEEELAHIAERGTNVDEQLSRLEHERAEIAAKIEEQLLLRYERIFEKKAPAVVPMNNGICGGCHMKLVAATVTTVKGLKVLTSCENCGRILYLGES
jgi:predicted  nucleic acid-binding Zn-ribbon protein